MRPFTILFFLLTPAVYSARLDISDTWTMFKSLHTKDYSALEDSTRFAIFENKTEYIVGHNLEADFDHHTYTLGLNSFADRTEEELKFMLNCIRDINFDYSEDDSEPYFSTNVSALEDSIDYRDRGVVTPVVNQGEKCGCCYIFGAVGALESAWALTKGNLVVLSEQNVLDCGPRGCDGGTTQEVYDYIIKNHGIMAAQDYEYKAEKSACKFESSKVKATMSSYKVFDKKYDEMMNAIAKSGPVTAYLNASPDSFLNYKSGIYADGACTEKVDHAVILVGYGTEGSQKFWIVKNSWGPEWGDKGYMKLLRGSNLCGITTHVVLPVV